MKVDIGWVAVNKITNKVRTGYAYTAGGKIYKTLPIAKAAVSKSNDINNFEFFEAFIEV